MPGCSGEPVVTTLVCITKKFARETAGALGARHSPRPHGRKDLQNPGALRRGNNFRRPGQAKREPGSITTDADDTSGWSPNPFHNPHLGLWVPAFAGTTKEGAARDVASTSGERHLHIPQSLQLHPHMIAGGKPHRLHEAPRQHELAGVQSPALGGEMVGEPG